VRAARVEVTVMARVLDGNGKELGAVSRTVTEPVDAAGLMAWYARAQGRASVLVQHAVNALATE